MKKHLLLSVLGLMTISYASAQRITEFSLEGVTQLTQAAAFNPKTSVPGDMQVVYPANVDLSNVKADFGTSLVDLTTVPTDFTSTVTGIRVTDEENKEAFYNITCKKINPTALPFELPLGEDGFSDSWTPETIGWASACIGKGEKNVRFGTSKAALVLNFSDSPAEMTYVINAAGSAIKNPNLSFLVEQSADGETWETVRQFTPANMPVSTDTDEQKTIVEALAPSTRYVRFFYAHRQGDNISITALNVTKNTDSSIDDLFTEGAVKIYPTAVEDVMHISSEREIARINVFNTMGQMVLSSNGATKISMAHLSQGVYRVVVLMADGSMGSQAIVKK